MIYLIQPNTVLKETEYMTGIDINKVLFSRKTFPTEVDQHSFLESRVSLCVGPLLVVVTFESVLEDVTGIRCAENMLAKP